MTTEYNPSEMSLTVNGLELDIKSNPEIRQLSLEKNTYILQLKLNVEKGSPEEKELLDYFFK